MDTKQEVLNFLFLLTRVKNLSADQIVTIGPCGINVVLVLLRSLCAIAHLKGIVPRVSKLSWHTLFKWCKDARLILFLEKHNNNLAQAPHEHISTKA